jgi:hypothetical protein
VRKGGVEVLPKELTSPSRKSIDEELPVIGSTKPDLATEQTPGEGHVTTC